MIKLPFSNNLIKYHGIRTGGPTFKSHLHSTFYLKFKKQKKKKKKKKRSVGPHLLRAGLSLQVRDSVIIMVK